MKLLSIIAGYMVPHPPLIIPAVGRGEEKGIAETVKAYEQVGDEIAALGPETIIITSPHTVMYSDYFHISGGSSAYGSFAQFRAPQTETEVKYDEELTDAICRQASDASFPAGTQGEKQPELDHATMIPLYFVNNGYRRAGKEPDYRVVRIGLSGYPLLMHYQLGMLVKKAVEETGRRAVWIASGDLSHKLKEDGPYGFDSDGPVYDKRIMQSMGSGNFGELLDYGEGFCEKAAECGHRSFTIMAGAFDGMGIAAEELSYEGPFGVGYGICTFRPGEPDAGRHFLKEYLQRQSSELQDKKSGEDEYVRLARKALETYIVSGRKIEVPKGLPQEMLDRQAGTFVSLHEYGRLRGCIGTIAPTCSSIAEEIIDNAISAATRDPRFDAVTQGELGAIEYSVDVLGPLEHIVSEEQLDVVRYGVVVTRGNKRGLLLPNLDGVDNVRQQISIAKQKAGIPEYEEDVGLQRFEVVRHL